MGLPKKFSIKRTMLLILKNIKESSRDYSIGIGAIFCFIFVMFILKSFFYQNLTTDYYDRLFFPVLFMSGVFITSRIFKNIHDRYLAHDWFMLPASNLEKFLEKLIISVFFFPVLFIFLFFVLTYFSSLILPFFLNTRAEVFNPVKPYILMGFWHYIILCSVFLPGAVIFKKNNFIKTCFSISVLFIASVIILVLIMKSVFHNNEFQMTFSQDDFDKLQNSMEYFFYFIKYFYFLCLAPLCWFISYNLLVKKQIP